MSDSQANNSCNKAGGDSGDVQNGLHGNSESLPVIPNCNLVAEPIQPIQPAVCQIAQPAAGGDNQRLEKDHNANNTEAAEANNNNNNANQVSQLQEEVLKRTHECDDFRKKLEETERKLSALQQQSANQSQQNGISSTPITNGDGDLRREVEDLRTNLARTRLELDDRERRVANQENQISALSKQVSSLKEVVAITKDMLSIRNMEVKHLQEDVDKMEVRIGAERDRHTAMINKMDAAVRLNADLKKEYQTQLKLFQDLRGKYEEKVTLLSEENRALETAVQAQPAQ